MRSDNHLPRFRCALAAASILLCGPALAQPPPGQPAPPASPSRVPLAQALTGAAKAEYETGKLLYSDGDFRGARIKFQRAHELSGDPRLLWNIAACEKSLRRYASVLPLLERYEREAGPLLTDAERQATAALIGEVKKLVSRLTVTVDRDGAEIFVDDEKIGASPLPGPVLVDIGARRIRVVKPGFKEHVRTEQIAGATEVTVAASLEEISLRGQLVVEAGDGDAIAVDGRVVAQGRWSGPLPRGAHAVRVTAPGKVPYQADVFIEEEKKRTLTVALKPLEQPGGSSATGLWIGGGIVFVATGLALGGYFLFKSRDPSTIPGIMGTVTLSSDLSGVRLGARP
ncbi:PEGA domain-containing protein [Sorangium sp. So ce131]|uniref:PEGA domain-containing protein n=1 Tax=Sorangium sp. So ce131 TaxID=3133282 RepID=UPI003F603902